MLLADRCHVHTRANRSARLTKVLAVDQRPAAWAIPGDTYPCQLGAICCKLYLRRSAAVHSAYT